MCARVLPPPGQESEMQDPPPSRPQPPTLGTSARPGGVLLALAHLWLQTPPPVSCPPCEREVRPQRPGGPATRGVGDGDTGPSWDDPARAPRGRNRRQTPRPPLPARWPPAPATSTPQPERETAKLNRTPGTLWSNPPPEGWKGEYR